jgi:hypothetical protein
MQYKMRLWGTSFITNVKILIPHPKVSKYFNFYIDQDHI